MAVAVNNAVRDFPMQGITHFSDMAQKLEMPLVLFQRIYYAEH
jgi:hypothetical protein